MRGTNLQRAGSLDGKGPRWMLAKHFVVYFTAALTNLLLGISKETLAQFLLQIFSQIGR
jgi:hypothetical protein